ncbi:unnamed protein product [Paramecium primaurelia]|uniref:Uncharacterized protein n=1 Tax=Paramecium primaurelia TaxID=5886 RepID=A0A8S1QVI2_PARPR|nr:unnamed protein product [Paramecium primaurelia]
MVEEASNTFSTYKLLLDLMVWSQKFPSSLISNRTKVDLRKECPDIVKNIKKEKETLQQHYMEEFQPVFL